VRYAAKKPREALGNRDLGPVPDAVRETIHQDKSEDDEQAGARRPACSREPPQKFMALGQGRLRRGFLRGVC
jgi:hypothetical protein